MKKTIKYGSVKPFDRPHRKKAKRLAAKRARKIKIQ